MSLPTGWVKSFDWVAMQALIDQGHGYRKCHAVFGIAHATFMKAIERGDISIDLDRVTKYHKKNIDWTAIQAALDAGVPVKDCRRRFNCGNSTWHKARRSGIITTPAKRLTAEELFAKPRLRGTVKRVLLRAGILENRCEWCGLTSWRGKPLSIQIDHRNGIANDHRLENLRMLCPNCHSQTMTYGGRNQKLKPQSRVV